MPLPDIHALCARTDKEIATYIRGLAAAHGPAPRLVDPQLVLMYRMAQCSKEEIAALLGVDINVLDREIERDPLVKRFFETGENMGKGRLRSAQFKSAVVDGNVTAQIWLGKQILGQKDEVSGRDAGEHYLNDLIEVMRVAKGQVSAEDRLLAQGDFEDDIIDVEAEPVPASGQGDGAVAR